MKLPLYQVDAFTAIPFKGNPAAVCFLQEPMPDAWMAAVAGEMNLSETAFLLPENDGYRLRWFTPAVEVGLCGHATLASAHTLWDSGRLSAQAEACFYTRAGRLTARKDGAWIEMNFPSRPVEPASAPEGLLEALGVTAKRIAQGGNTYIIELTSEAEVRAAAPDFSALARLPLRSVGVTSRAAMPGYDIVSRYFAPQVGVNEDPVTGSLHCRLAPYWSAILGKNELSAYQASARGGELRLRLEDDRVRLGGQAVTVLEGSLQC
ncbi:phenazine biosynthesis protein PhzF family [Longilinea arvoryzae]|uniref:Phenazine biosynthesis protein PhzF family n=1 Tax=Longilinea arvoryzae TaxID=360412 RepID=A0A0S7BF61_9CHLR|nr:PhzF family phenazine biosynthesis protein [Longilinea arvoryzae]GAP12401.1 phenazine biosynthesis protein PhzF family [Longilinea arvoryzae]